MALVIFFVLLCGCLSLGLEPGGFKEVQREVCRVCKYDLAGLSKDALCPECGIETPHTDFVTLPANVVIRWQVFVRSVVVMLVWILVASCWRDIVGLPIAMSYVHKGLTPSMAIWAVRQYELNPQGPGDGSVLQLCWPMLAGLLPMILTVPMPWKWYWRINSVLIALGVALLMGRWVVANV